MKKHLIFLALILVTGVSVTRSQQVASVMAADMASIKSTGFEFRFVLSVTDDLAVSVRATNPPSRPNDTTTSIAVRMNFQNESRTAFDTGGVKLPLKLQMVDEETGTSNEFKIDKNGEFRLLSGELPNTYKFILNGLVIATGYKPPKY